MKRKNIEIIILFILILLVGACRNSQEVSKAQAYPHYSISLRIEPASGEISVDGTLHIPADRLPDRTLTLYLDRVLTVRSFQLENGTGLERDSSKSDIMYMPEAVKYFAEPPGGETEISFSYWGKLSVLPEYFANTIGSEWTEIGLYYPWFPFCPGIGLFTYDVEIEAGTSYNIFGIGKNGSEAGKAFLRTVTPTSDIVICTAKNIKELEWQSGNNILRIFHHGIPDSVTERMKSDLDGILSGYTDWFGEIPGEVNIIESGRKTGGGYTRPGGIFMGGFEPTAYVEKNESYLRYFAHELAHLWWNRADTDSWEDWLNEGFAEYSALMIIRRYCGEEDFLQRLEEKQERLESHAALWGFDTTDQSDEGGIIAREILYSKGPVLLSMLEKRTGQENFISLCRDILENKKINTLLLLKVLEEKEGQETASWFRDLLENY